MELDADRWRCRLVALTAKHEIHRSRVGRPFGHNSDSNHRVVAWEVLCFTRRSRLQTDRADRTVGRDPRGIARAIHPITPPTLYPCAVSRAWYN